MLVRRLEELSKTARIVPAVNQVEYVANLDLPIRAHTPYRLHPYLAQNDLLEYCKKKGIVLTAYTPTGMGALLDALTADHESCVGYNAVRGDTVIMELAEKYKVQPAQIILAWHVARGTAAVPNSKNPEHQRENITVDLNLLVVISVNSADGCTLNHSCRHSQRRT